MTKASKEIEELITAGHEARNAAKEEMRQQIEILEIQRHKHLFEAKHECLIEVADAIVDGLKKAAAIDKGKILMSGLLTDKVNKFMDKIASNVEEIEAIILSREGTDETASDVSTENLKHWRQCLQNNIDKIIDIYEPSQDPGVKAPMDDTEYGLLQKKIVDEVLAKTHFFQSVKRVEDKEINKFFDRKVKEAEECFEETAKRINADLAEQIGELMLTPVTDAIANITLNTDHSIYADNLESEEASLAGDNNAEPV